MTLWTTGAWHVGSVEFTALADWLIRRRGRPLPNGFGSTKDFPGDRGDFTDAKEQVAQQVQRGLPSVQSK